MNIIARLIGELAAAIALRDFATSRSLYTLAGVVHRPQDIGPAARSSLDQEDLRLGRDRMGGLDIEGALESPPGIDRRRARHTADRRAAIGDFDIGRCDPV